MLTASKRILSAATEAIVARWNKRAKHAKSARHVPASFENLEQRHYLSAPAAPSNLVAELANSETVSLAWTDNSLGETGFRVDWATDDTFTSNLSSHYVGPLSDTGGTQTDTVGVSPEQCLYFRVVAVNDDGDSSPTDTKVMPWVLYWRGDGVNNRWSTSDDDACWSEYSTGTPTWAWVNGCSAVFGDTEYTTVTVVGAITVQDLSSSGNYTISASSGSISLREDVECYFDVAQGCDTSISTSITGSTLHKTGEGLLTFAGSNSFVSVSLDGGVLATDNDEALGDGSAACDVTVNSGATLSLEGHSITESGAVVWLYGGTVLNDSGTASVGTVWANTGASSGNIHVDSWHGSGPYIYIDGGGLLDIDEADISGFGFDIRSGSVDIADLYLGSLGVTFEGGGTVGIDNLYVNDTVGIEDAAALYCSLWCGVLIHNIDTASAGDRLTFYGNESSGSLTIDGAITGNGSIVMSGVSLKLSGATLGSFGGHISANTIVLEDLSVDDLHNFIDNLDNFTAASIILSSGFTMHNTLTIDSDSPVTISGSVTIDNIVLDGVTSWPIAPLSNITGKVTIAHDMTLAFPITVDTVAVVDWASLTLGYSAQVNTAVTLGHGSKVICGSNISLPAVEMTSTEESTITVDAGRVMTVGAVTGSAGYLLKDGTGSLVLTGQTTANVAIVVVEGQLTVSGTVSSSKPTYYCPNGSIIGSGWIKAPVIPIEPVSCFSPDALVWRAFNSKSATCACSGSMIAQDSALASLPSAFEGTISLSSGAVYATLAGLSSSLGQMSPTWNSFGQYSLDSSGLDLQNLPKMFLAGKENGVRPRYVIEYAGGLHWFQQQTVGGPLVPIYGGNERLSSNENGFTFTDAKGNSLTFAGSTSGVYEFTGMSGPGDLLVTASSSAIVIRQANVTDTYSFSRADDVITMTLTRNENETPTRIVDYYLDESDRVTKAVIKDGTGEHALETYYYRWYANNLAAGSNAYPGALKMVFDDGAYKRLMAATNNNAEGASDVVAAKYATNVYGYDIQHKAYTSTTQGSGCSTVACGKGTFTFSFGPSTVQLQYPGTGSATRTVTLGTKGQILTDTTSATVGQSVTTQYEYDEGDRLTSMTDAQGNVTTYVYYPNVSGSGTVSESAGVYTLTDGSGSNFGATGLGALGVHEGDLVHLGEYDYAITSVSGATLTLNTTSHTPSLVSQAYSITRTALAAEGGGVDGYLWKTLYTPHLGTQRTISAVTYVAVTIGSQTTYMVKTDISYPQGEENPSFDTTYEYTNGVISKITSSAPGTELGHGPGSVQETVTICDEYGRPVWTKDSDGFISYTEYDAADGSVKRTITDVDTTENETWTVAIPIENNEEWATPSSGGKHLVTQYESDDLGRTTKVTDPNNVVTYTVYNDAANEVRTYPGWRYDSTASKYVTTGPILIQRTDSNYLYAWTHTVNGQEVTEYLQGSYEESLSLAIDPTVDSGGTRPNGQEVIVGNVNKMQSLSRTFYNVGGQMIASHEYHSFKDTSGNWLSYTQSVNEQTGADFGTAGQNYYATTYSYNRRGWVKRELDATGVITRTFYDKFGNVTSTFVGTDDTLADGSEWNDPDSALPSSIDLVKVSNNVYSYEEDADIKLVESQTFHGTSAYYSTKYAYDDEGRQIIVVGPDNVATYYGYDVYGNVEDVKVYADTDGDILNSQNPGHANTPEAAELRAWTHTEYDEQGRPYEAITHKIAQINDGTNLPGADLATFVSSETWYNARGMVWKTTDASGLIYETVYDGVGRTVASYQKATVNSNVVTVKGTFNVYAGDQLREVWVGTTSGTGGDAQPVQLYTYDDGGRVTDIQTPKPKATLAHDSSDFVTTHYDYDSAGRQYAVTTPDPDGAGELKATRTETTFDALSRVTGVNVYAVGSTNALMSQSENHYDSAGRLDYTRAYKNGSNTDYLQTTYGYDWLSRLVKTTQPSGAFTKNLYDAWGTLQGTYVGTSEGATSSLSDDIIIEQTVPYYDALGRVWMTVSSQRRSDDTTTPGALTPTDARVTYNVTWFDDMSRVKWQANYGTNDGVALTDQSHFDGNTQHGYADAAMSRPANTSSAFIVSEYQYDTLGRGWLTIDNAGHKTATFYDNAGRQTYVAENYVNFSSADESGTGGGTNKDQDRVTKYVYNPAGLLSQQVALDVNADGNTADSQVTDYIYAFDLNATHKGSPILDNTLLRATRFPDANNGATPTPTPIDRDDVIAALNNGDPGDFIENTYNADGSVHTTTDQRGVKHTFAYDALGRQIADTVDFGSSSGVDQTVKAITRVYDQYGRLVKLTSHTTATDNPALTTDIANQITWTYNDWGQVATVKQQHSGPTTVSGTPVVTYSYADGLSNHVAKYVRLTSVTYPSGMSVNYSYGISGSIDDVLCRVASISYGNSSYASGTATYSYLGIGTVVKFTRPNLVLSYGADGSAGLDRFGRIEYQTWTDEVTPTANILDQFVYAYDSSSNVVSKNSLWGYVDSSDFDDVYEYDGLNRLIDTNRDSTDYQHWTLDAVGNAQEFLEFLATQVRTFDAANQIATITDSVTPKYDAAGNMIFGPLPTNQTIGRHYVYDAWNRLVEVWSDVVVNEVHTKNARLVTYKYDGLSRRMQSAVEGGATDDSYYNDSFQVIEVRRGGDVNPLDTYVYDLRYVDSLIVQYHDGSTDGDTDDIFDAVLYPTTDANYNITMAGAAVGTSGGFLVLERYVYSPYGERKVFSRGYEGGMPWMQGDANHDGTVDLTDDAIMNAERGGPYTTINRADFDADGYVNSGDSDLLGGNFGGSLPALTDVGDQSRFGMTHGHQGQQHDANTGFIHALLRDLDPRLNVWTTRDQWVWYAQGMSLGQYEGGNPVVRLDPSGAASLYNGWSSGDHVVVGRGRGSYGVGKLEWYNNAWHIRTFEGNHLVPYWWVAENAPNDKNGLLAWANNHDQSRTISAGRDYSKELRSVLREVDAHWQKMTEAQRCESCGAVFDLLQLQFDRAWDINELHMISRNGYREIERAVVVDGVSYDAAAVNYVLYGKIARLCGHGENYIELIHWWKYVKYLGSAPDDEVMSWAVAGYYGWPSDDAYFHPVSTTGYQSPNANTSRGDLPLVVDMAAIS